MSSGNPKRNLYAQFAAVAKAIGNEHRLELLELVAQGDRSVDRSVDRNTEIVAYCRGPYCVLSLEAVAQLRKLGFKARRLQDGLPEWRAAGLPVEIGRG